MEQRSQRHGDPFLRKRKHRVYDDSERYADASEEGHRNSEVNESYGCRDEEDLNLPSGSEISDWKEAEDGPPSLSGSIENKLRELTKDFSLCYRDIKDSHVLKEAPLNTLTTSRLQQIIKQKR